MYRALLVSVLTLLLASCVRSFSPEGTRLPFPTPTLYSGSPTPAPAMITPAPDTAAAIDPGLCRAEYFEISSGVNEVAARMMIGVTLRNISAMNCTLTGNPQVELFDRHGNPIAIEIRDRPGAETPVLDVRAGETIVISLVWNQWCNSFSGDGIEIHLTLAEGELIEQVETIQAGTCSPSGSSSTLTISGFGYTP